MDLSELKLKLICVDMLNVAKRRYKYRELSRVLKLPPTVLNRYCKARTLPSVERAMKICDKLVRIVWFDIRLSPQMCDPHDLRLVAGMIVKDLYGRRVTRVLTSVLDNVPLATLVSDYLDKPLVVATLKPTMNVDDMVFSAGSDGTLMFVPREALSNRDSVLIVCEGEKTGGILKSIVSKFKADVTDVIATGKLFKR